MFTKWIQGHARNSPSAIAYLGSRRCEISILQSLEKATVLKFWANYPWHIDFYDKLSLFGIYINGAIDDYSRYMPWLKVNVTNSDPQVIDLFHNNFSPSI